MCKIRPTVSPQQHYFAILWNPTKTIKYTTCLPYTKPFLLSDMDLCSNKTLPLVTFSSKPYFTRNRVPPRIKYKRKLDKAWSFNTIQMHGPSAMVLIKQIWNGAQATILFKATQTALGQELWSVSYYKV